MGVVLVVACIITVSFTLFVPSATNIVTLKIHTEMSEVLHAVAEDNDTADDMDESCNLIPLHQHFPSFFFFFLPLSCVFSTHAWEMACCQSILPGI